MCLATLKVCFRLRPLISATHSRLFSKTCSLCVNNFKAKNQPYNRNYQDSFQIWILNMFKDNSKYSTFKPPASLTTDSTKLTELDFSSLLKELWVKKFQEALTPIELRKFDAEICLRLSSNPPISDVLSCLQIFVETVPIQASKLQSFKQAIRQMEKTFKKSPISSHDTVQAMYYASHLKTDVAAKSFMLAAQAKLSVSALNELDTNDLGVFCISLFRSSVPLEKPLKLNYLAERLKHEIDPLLMNNSAIFTCFIKCFRISNHYDNELLCFLASQGIGTLSSLDTSSKLHLGIFFSVSHYGDVSFITKYFLSIIQDFDKKISNDRAPRLKDFDNLLWSCGVYHINELNEEIKNSRIPKYISESLCLLRNNPHSQVALLLWLWICECRLEREVARFLQPDTVQYIADSKHFKGIANLFLLLTCIQLESPGLLKQQIINYRDNRMRPKFDKYMTQRPCLRELFKFLQRHSKDLQLENLKFAFQVPALFIGGFYAEYQGTPISIEVIDQSVCLANSKQLKGKMQLKLRLLEKLGTPILLIPGSATYEIDQIQLQLSTITAQK